MRVEIYLAANKITDAQQKRDVLLSVCGPKTYHHILRDFLAPTKPSDTSYADIVKCLKAQFNPKQGVAVHRYKFNSRVRQRGESVASFVAELRHLAIDCEFGDSLNEMLRDRLVCGVNDSRIQRRSRQPWPWRWQIEMQRISRATRRQQRQRGPSSGRALVNPRLSKLLQVRWETQGAAMQTQGDCLSSLWEEGAHP